MGLIQCPDCGKDVSEKARSCLHCGMPQPGANIKKTPPPPKKKLILPYQCVLILGGICLATGFWCLLFNQFHYALLSLVLGLPLTVAGSIWGWIVKD